MPHTQQSVIASLLSLQGQGGTAFLELFDRVNDGDLESLFTFDEWEAACMANGWA